MQWYVVELQYDKDRQQTATWTGMADSEFEAEKVAEVAYIGFSAVSVKPE